MTQGWPALDRLLEALRTAPSRTGSVISTVYGDAILPRGGCLALADLLALMARLGVAEGVVRTAVSRLARDGLLEGRRAGRHSAYALTERAQAEFLAAVPRIYGPAHRPWDGRLKLAFPETAAERAALEAAGLVSLAPGVLVTIGAAPVGVTAIESSGPEAPLRDLARRAWPLERLGSLYSEFLEMFDRLMPVPSIAPLEAIAARIVLIHAWRRIALKDPRLPADLLPESWPGDPARTLCVTLYNELAARSEEWLDGAGSLAGRLPPGGDPACRFFQ